MKKYLLVLSALLCLACEEKNQPVEPREESDSIVFEGSKNIEAAGQAELDSAFFIYVPKK